MTTGDVYERVLHHVITLPDEKFSLLSVGTLAYSFGINRYKLLREFKRSTQMTLEDFLFREKMSRASFLLRTGKNMRVKDVSEIIGFCTCGYFIKKFKEFYGLQPGKYKALKSRNY